LEVPLASLALALGLAYLALTGIGLGPAVLLTGRRVSLTALAIAAPLGFAVTALVASYLVSLDRPVGEWALAYTLVASAASGAYAAYTLRGAMVRPFLRPRASGLFAVSGLVLTFVLLASPPAAGGEAFTTLRGNGTDTFNYLTLAAYLDREPYSWAFAATPSALTERNPAYLLAQALLSTRWTTSVLIAWTSHVAGVPLYKASYVFSLLCLLLTFTPTYLLAVRLALPRVAALLLALATAAGFWPQLVLDMQALSHLNVLSLILLFAWLLTRWFAPTPPAGRYYFLLGIAGASVTVVYAEIVPLLVLGTALAVVRYSPRVWSAAHRAVPLAAATVLALLLAGPLLRVLVPYLLNQLSYGAQEVNNWHEAYFVWLYGNFLRGFWGLSTLRTDPRLTGPLPPQVVAAATAFTGLLLSLLLVGAVGYALARPHKVWRVLPCACLSLTAAIPFAVLFARGQLWSAGKALSFGYPFFTATAVTAAFLAPHWLPRYKDSPLLHALRWLAVWWLLLQLVVAGHRMVVATSGQDPPNYIWHHGEYRRHDWNLGPFEAELAKHPGAPVWLAVSNPWLQEYLLLAFSNAHPMLGVNVPRYGPVPPSDQDPRGAAPHYAIVEMRAALDLAIPSRYVVAATSEFVLLDLVRDPPAVPLILRFLNPSGIERDIPPHRFFWLGGPPTHLSIFVPEDGELVLAAHFIPGPSRPDDGHRTLQVRFARNAFTETLILGSGELSIVLPVQQGIINLTLQVLEQPTVSPLPNGDTRALLLGVQDLRLGLRPRSAPSP
jgi:hypothetical protein